jgi:hypothetical protein
VIFADPARHSLANQRNHTAGKAEPFRNVLWQATNHRLKFMPLPIQSFCARTVERDQPMACNGGKRLWLAP